MKRTQRVTVRGKSVGVMEYLRDVARDLPVFENPKTGQRVDHVKGMQRQWMDNGMDGVKQYLIEVDRVLVDQNNQRIKMARAMMKKSSVKIRSWQGIKMSVLLWTKLAMNWMRHWRMKLSVKVTT